MRSGGLPSTKSHFSHAAKAFSCGRSSACHSGTLQACAAGFPNNGGVEAQKIPIVGLWSYIIGMDT